MWLTGLPRGKRAAWNGNQLLPKALKIMKTAFKQKETLHRNPAQRSL
jgi:hypothetical protein